MFVCTHGCADTKWHYFQAVGIKAERWRIIEVEDEERLNRNIVNSLRKDGYTVNGATNGRDAVRILWAEVYDIVICDLNTPGADGFELLHWLRVYRPNTRVILVGGSAPSLRTQALEGGAVSYLEKPLDIHLLKEELRRLLVQTGFSADLDSFDLLDVIQIVSASRKSIALLISTGLEERGMLCFQNGNLVWAEYGMLRGEEAFFALAAHKTGTVVHQPWNQQVQPNVTQPLSRLILQAFQYRTKYNQMQQQFSGEQKAVVPPSFTRDDDDTPFMVLTEHVTDQIQEPFPAQSNTFVPINASPVSEQDMLGRNGVHGMSESEKEWWEQTGKFSGINMRPTPSNIPVTPLVDTSSSESNSIHAPLINEQKETAELHDGIAENGAASAQHNDLPSWLTDQPTAPDIPVVSHSDSAPMRAVRLSSPATPIVPPPIEWQATQIQRPVRTSKKLVEQRVKEMTGPQKTLKIDTSGRTAASPEWQPSDGDGQPRSGPLQSLTPSRRISNTHPLQQRHRTHGENGTSSSDLQAMPRHSNAKRNYNYDALVSTLQTLGYSINGFVAAAVVSIDGQPIAQVAVDDLDMSRMCKHFSVVMKSVFQSLDVGVWGACEDVVITSVDRHILLRVIGHERNAFQVLVTTREAKPTESGAVMANVEGAIASALR